jgi:hypothetical protein
VRRCDLVQGAKLPRSHHGPMLTELALGSGVYTVGPRRAERVMRRLTAILAIWLSLVGVAMPALACSMGVDAAGCCPVRTHSPCGGSGELQSNATAAPCCSAVPASTAGPAVEPSCSNQSSLHPGTPDQFVGSGCTAINPVSAAAHRIFPTSIPTHRADAALTYLRTGRLRL